MGIESIMSTSLSALQANQNALRVTSTNVANVNTEGYTRVDAHFKSRQALGSIYGVQVDMQRAANAFLAAAEMRSAANVAGADLKAAILDRAQGLLGDPSDGTSVFSSFDEVLNAFGSLAVDPSSNLRRSSALSSLETFANQLNRTSIELNALRDETNARLQSSVEEANGLMATIAKLNASIQQATIAGSDPTQAQSEQSGLIDRLSEIVDIKVEQRSLGGVNIRTTDGFLLVDNEAASFRMNSGKGLNDFSHILVRQPHSQSDLQLETHLSSGEISTLLSLRDVELADLASAFGEYASGAIDALNAAHNDTSAVPAPRVLTGQNTGLLAGDRHRFTGEAHMAVVDPSGVLVASYRIDFDGGQIYDSNNNPVQAFADDTIGGMTSAINTVLAGHGGGAQFTSGGKMIIDAGATGATDNGIVFRQDSSDPSSRNGRGFAHAFGLNNILEKSTPTNFDTGLQLDSPLGVPAGSTFVLDVTSADGSVLKRAEVAISAGATQVADLIADINANLSGYGSVSLDSNTGRLTFSPASNSPAARMNIITDETERGSTGLSVSDIFGLNEVSGALRAQNIKVRQSVVQNPNLLGTARPDIAGLPPGTVVLGPGDGRGAQFVEAAGDVTRSFGAAGYMSSQVSTANDYGARLAGMAGSRAVAAETGAKSATAIREEVAMRRAGDEGVNIDEELVKMTQYQQAYAAASRMIQAAQELYDTLLSIVR